MPDPEVKPRPRHVYNNCAVLRHMAHVAGSYVVGVKDDGRHFFFQFEVAPEGEWTCSFALVMEIDGELWFVTIVATCMNMGSRNASKIAQSFTNEWLEAWARQLDVYVERVWLPKQPPALQDLLRERRQALGHADARPFHALGYTDNFFFEYLGPSSPPRARVYGGT